MIKHIDECMECASPLYPCQGEACRFKRRKILVCDRCGYEADKLYLFENRFQLCDECLMEQFDTVNIYDD
jgi:hypothetical protein